MNADRGIYVGKSFGNGDAFFRRFVVNGNIDDAHNPRFPSAQDDVLPVRIESIEIQVGVGVDEGRSHRIFAPLATSRSGTISDNCPDSSSAASSMPLDSIPRIVDGLRLAMTVIFLPTRFSGLYQAAMPATICRVSSPMRIRNCNSLSVFSTRPASRTVATRNSILPKSSKDIL